MEYRILYDSREVSYLRTLQGIHKADSLDRIGAHLYKLELVEPLLNRVYGINLWQERISILQPTKAELVAWLTNHSRRLYLIRTEQS